MLDTLNPPPHFPADPEKFNFSEVAPIFQNMASRSIPGYDEAHQLHVRMLKPWMDQEHVKILDVGASRGRFIDHLVTQYGELRLHDGSMDITALDNSLPMCDVLRTRYPSIGVRVQDLSADEFIFGEGVEQYDVICAYYVLQFIHPSNQIAVLRRLMALLKLGGVLIIGQKSAANGLLGELAHEQYIEWRVGNGYSREEIEAKTHALRFSMWPMDYTQVITTLARSMREIQETTRSGVFNTLMARK